VARPRERHLSVSEDWLQKWEARERELHAQFAGGPFSAEAVDVFVEGTLQQEIAAETGTDVAAIRAMGLIRKYGLRQAQKLVRNGAYQSALEGIGGEDAIDENRRIGQHLAAYRAELPWWRRTLGI
jgi:hypothetical protein